MDLSGTWRAALSGGTAALRVMILGYVLEFVFSLAILVTLLAVISKIIGCGLAAWPLGKKKALQVGVGMVPRGEVGIVVAQIGLGLHAVGDAAYGVVLVMAIATTLIAPPFLVRLYQGEQRTDTESVIPVSPLS